MEKFLSKLKALFDKVKQIKHIKLIAAIGAGVLVLAIALIILLVGMQSPALTPAQQYIKLETDLLHKLVDSVPTQEIEGSALTSIDILPADALLSLLGMEDMDWAKKLTINLDATQKDGLQKALWDFELNGNDLFTATTITDPVAGITYLVVPSVSEHFLKIDENAAGDLENGEIVGSASAITDFLAMLNISEADVAKSIINKYIDIFFSHMTEVEKQTQLISVGDKSQSAEVYTNYITEKVFTDALRAVLTEARGDVALKAIFPEDVDYTELIDTMLDELSSEPANDREDAIILKLYVDNTGSVIGRDLILPDMKVSVLTATDENGTACKLLYGNEDLSYALTVDGAGKGTVSMVQPDQTVILVNLAYSGTKESGICEITLSDFIESTLLQSTDLDPKLEINWNGSDLSFALYASADKLVTINTSANIKEGPYEDIEIPEASLDYSVQDEYDAYMESVDWTIVRANMLEAGIPKNMVDFLLGKE